MALLAQVLDDFERRVITDAAPTSDADPNGRGRRLVLALDDHGPDLSQGNPCRALDVRNTWCNAEVAASVSPTARDPHAHTRGGCYFGS